jgi:hypothetical protein
MTLSYQRSTVRAAVNAPKRSPLFWIVVLLVGSCAVCSVGTMGLAALGVLAGAPEPSPTTTAPSSTGEWIPAGEIARGTGLTQQLVGGRWLHQSGSGLETVVAQFTNTALVQLSSTGELHELSFDGDGTYRWAWVNSSNFQGTHRSAADERGSWVLEGNTLTLTPSSQKALYVANDQSQEKEDVDLGARTYQLTDITLETVPNTGAPMKRFPGVELRGPRGPWDLSGNAISLDLQRL